YWEDPETFDPDRFSPERFTEKQKRAFLPFSAGPRLCIGNNFALMEMALVLAVLVPRFHFRLDATRRVEAEAGVTLRPKNGLWMYVENAENV
ncbi:MAG: cytochrome P450, partial [Spirochaetia bacterium]|nr:cytochrome P450 [Spirochaetia bacterium]